ncbi:MAG: hypothetical protein IJT58_00595 [Synergistaceae bacterium]|nr:hypothetical protein [Synergistaceae bacterium]
MAKIKFNLNFGGEQIRTLDDLRENFSIEDILDVFNNGMLVKWLDARNHKDELAKVKAIQATDARSILSELIHIFGVTSDESEIQESLSVLDYLEGRKKFWADIKAGNFDETARQQGKERVLLNYHEGYNALVQNIIDHPDELHYIYDQLDVIVANYPEMLKANALELYKRLYSIAPLAVMALFGNSATRPYFDERNLKNGAVAALLGCKSFSTSFYDDYIRGFNRYNKIQIPNNVKKEMEQTAALGILLNRPVKSFCFWLVIDI